MEPSLSGLSSLKEEDNAVYVQPHYKESYRLAIYALICGGQEAYEEFLRAEQINHFLSEEETAFILQNAELPVLDDESEGRGPADDGRPSTYFPVESDEEVPDLELGWPEVHMEGVDTSISLLFHPPRHNTPTIKEVIRKQVQEARQIIALAMDIFTDVDIFKELISATLRGVVVYILLDNSHVKSFLTMTHRVGINIQDFKNLRVRIVQGQQYQCRSGIKFHGGLEQKFLLVDCQTVMYGTYSYTWSFEKINLSMVLVVTGQLVCSYDEEFRRLYARSTVPVVLSRERPSAPYLRDTVGLHSPNSSQLSLNHSHMRSMMIHGMRGAQDDRLMMTRGVSVQERLHQSHCPDIGTLVRGHSYGGELQKLNSLTRLRMGTKDIGAPFPPERNGFNPKAGGDLPLTNRLSQQHLRHQNRYGADQNLIPFNSETSLHRWKMDTYFNEGDMLDASCEAISPLTSPYNSYTALNEHQSQLIHSRSRDMRARIEDVRQKRLSLQEYANLRQSQESLRSMYPALERTKYLPSFRSPEMRQSMIDLEPQAQERLMVKDTETKREGDKREQIVTDGHRTSSHYDVKTERNTMQTYDWHDPLSRTTSAIELDNKPNDTSLKLSHSQPSGLAMQHQRAMESLTQIPEEKEGSNGLVNTSDPALKEKNEETCKDDNPVPKEKPVKPGLPAESEGQAQGKGSHGSIHKLANSIGSGPQREKQKSASSEVEPAPASQHEASNSHVEEAPPQREEAPLQRKNSFKMKVHSILKSDEKKALKKEEKSLQRKGSLRLPKSSASNSDHSLASSTEQTAKKSPSNPRSQDSPGPSEPEKHKSPFSRLSSHRSSKKKAALAAEQEQSSSSTLEEQPPAIFQARREKAYSRFEYLLSTENDRLDKSVKTTNTYSSDKEKSASLNRRDAGLHQGQSGSDKKFGRLMQRVGSLINKK